MLQKEKLFEQFPPVTTREWMEKINADLKGADFNKKLVWRSDEGFDVNPFYRAEDTENLPFINTLPGEFPYIRGTKVRNNSWFVRQDIEVSDYVLANRKALEILMKGVDSIGFSISDPESVNMENFQALLKNIHPESIELNFSCNGKAKEILEILAGLIPSDERSGIHGAMETDPLSRLMLNGKLCVPVESGLEYLSSVTASAAVFPRLRTIQINASNFNNAGADIVQELAFAISMGSEYLSQLISRGLRSDFAASKIGFSFGTGSNYFPEIAKLRAARLLWSVVNRGYNPENEKITMNIHCITSRWNKTIYDPYVNMLRTQTEAMSAILGGADSVTVEPFDTVFRQPGEFSERIARNQQLLLKEESYFDKVADPSAGSYYIETLTSLIAENAWKLFVEVEEKGGFLSCLKSGFIQDKVSQSASHRKTETAKRRIIFLGTNIYPDSREKVSPAVDLNRAFYKNRETKDFSVTPLEIFRATEQYEMQRITVERAARRPVVFLLQIGDPLMRKARAKFSSEFFGCAGYGIIEKTGFDNVSDGIREALISKADIVVVCSSDDEYLLYAPEIFEGLNNNAIVVIAGNPASTDLLKSKGIESFIHLGSDIPATLGHFNKMMGISL
jgi:methylmalonyl-CoA mutase